MADRVAEVRRIAIERRGVTPRLTGAAYARAVQQPALRRRSARRRATASKDSSSRRSTSSSHKPVPRRWSRTSSPPSRNGGGQSTCDPPGVEEDPLRGADSRLDGGTGDGRPRGAPAGRAVIYNRLEREYAPRDRRDPALRPRDPRHETADKGASAKQLAVQHAPLQGSPADTDRQPRPGINPRRRRPAHVDYLYYVRNRTRSTTSSPQATKSSAGKPVNTATAARPPARREASGGAK